MGIVEMIHFLAKCPRCAQLRPQTRRRALLHFEVANLESIECSCTVCDRRWVATARDLANIKRLLREGVGAAVVWIISESMYLSDLSWLLMV